MVNIIALIQARMSSKRFSGKSLMPILGEPLVYRVVERVRSVPGIDKVIVATSFDESDAPLAEALHANNVHVFRGDLENVQQRFFDAACHYEADSIIRVTGDNPLIDPGLIKNLIDAWREKHYDYVACENCIPGVGAELFTMEAFRQARALPGDAFDHEHVTPPFWRHEELFDVYRVPVPAHLKPQDIMLTVDTEEQYREMVKLYERFYKNGKIDLREVVASLRKEQ